MPHIPANRQHQSIVIMEIWPSVGDISMIITVMGRAASAQGTW
jgi:hypothetical protein